MKLLILLSLCCAVFTSPIALKEEETGREHQPRFALVPDTDGRMFLSDLNAEDIEPAFNPVTDVLFNLFTRQNPTAFQRIAFDANAIRNSNFGTGRDTRFIIHGWNNNGGSPVNSQIRDAYLRAFDVNVIVVDWGAGAQTANYISARNRVGDVGGRVAAFIDFLHQNALLTNFNRVMIAGHSLGAHAAGNAGKRVTRGRIQSIFGMDPAGPLFSMGSADRMAASDAVYVEGLITNGGGLGFMDPIATATFYPNWGQSQPGCGIDASGACAHGRVTDFFAESIWNNNFWATRCANFAQINNRQCTSTGTGRRMGGNPGNVGTGADGVFFLETNAAAPFARGPR